jgi:hypothetical protein
MAQIVTNPDGTFSSVAGETDISDMTYEDMQEVNEDADQVDDWSDMEESEADPDLFSPGDIPSAGDESYTDFMLDSDLEPYASVPSSASFTPVAWQVNLASNRSLGEHYLMYAVRRNYGSSSYYMQYYLVRGRDIEYANNVYTYSGCDVYTYYTYSSTVFYEATVSSGTVSGASSLVYSDLYFDYVATDPVDNILTYIVFLYLLVIIILLVIGGRRRV